MEQLSITEKTGANYKLLELKGGISAYTCSEFQTKLYDYINVSNIVMDLSTAIELDSTGMGIIMAAINDGENSGYKIYFMNPSPEVRKTMENTGFYDYFNIINSVTEVH